MHVREVEPPATYDLRRRVLRSHSPGLDVANAEDDVPGAFHLAVVDGGAVVAVASFSPDAQGAVRLRGMAVEPARQSQGLGALLVDAGVARLRAVGVSTVWANARLAALAFYERNGFTAVGEPFVEIGIPHVRVVRQIAPDVQSRDG